MAVTIEQGPFSLYTPSGNPVVYTFSSDQTGQANFSFLVEVYVDGVLQGRQQVFPESGNVGRIDCRSYAETYTNIPAIVNTPSVDAANHAEINIKVIERYGNPIADGADATSNAVTVFKAGMSNADFINWDSSLFVFDGGITDNAIFTTFPSSEVDKCAEGEQKRLMMLSDFVISNMKVEFFSEFDINILTDNIAVPSVKIIINNVGLKNLLEDGVVTQTQIDNSAYYVITFDDGVTGESVPYRINIDRECKKETSKRLHFMSTYGTIESFTYSLYSNISGSIKSNRYTKEFGNFNGSAYEFDLNSGTNMDYRKRAERKMLLRSNWMSQAVQKWHELNISLAPLAYIEDSDDPNLGLRRVSTDKQNFAYKTTKQNILFREDLTIILDSHNSVTL